MTVTVNGETRELPEGSSLRDLVVALGLGERPVAAEVEGEVVPRARHGERILADGESVELVTLVGGG